MRRVWEGEGEKPGRDAVWYLAKGKGAVGGAQLLGCDPRLAGVLDLGKGRLGNAARLTGAQGPVWGAGVVAVYPRVVEEEANDFSAAPGLGMRSVRSAKRLQWNPFYREGSLPAWEHDAPQSSAGRRR